MLLSRSFLLALCLSAAPVLAQPHDVSALVAAPSSTLEAQTARELNAIAPAILSRHTGNDSDSDKAKLAFAFARLGRIDAGVRAANAIEVQDADVFNGGPLTRDEVRRIGSQRRAVLGNIAGAQQLAATIENARLHASALLSIARAQTRVGSKVEAQKTLFQALKLVGEDRTAQTYIAVLFDRADEPGASKRLLDRVEKSLPPPTPTKPASMRAIRSIGNWDYFFWALFQTGRVANREQIEQISQGYYSPNLLMGLVRRGDVELAEQLVRKERNGSQQLGNLTLIAWGIRRSRPERAMALAQEISEDWRKIPQLPNTFDFKGPSPRDMNLVLLAALYRELGHESEANALLDKITQNQEPSSAAYMRFFYALAPLIYEDDGISNGTERSTLSPATIERISAEANTLLPTTDVVEFAGIMPDFVDAQIEAGTVASARQTLKLLEERTLSGSNTRDQNTEQKRDDANLLNPALSLGRAWQKLGDKTYLDDYLNRVWDSPIAKNIKPRDRAWKFISFGFVDEGQKRLQELGIAPQEPIYQYSSLAYFEAKFKPTSLPNWLSTVPNPHKRLDVLSDFSQGLTESLFQSPSEREFTLTAGGSGYSLSF